ncbi:MAG: hypothetical protein MMC33_002758 [Icmadophila ericetorum]|nr:hypothetical protein [Icmadophila ericetorum]
MASPPVKKSSIPPSPRSPPAISENSNLNILVMAANASPTASPTALGFPRSPRSTTNYPNNPYLPAFTFCGPFTGTGALSAHKWLQRFEYEHLRAYYPEHATIPPSFYLSAVEMLLEGPAATWFSSSPHVLALFAKDTATEHDVQQFKDWIMSAFPGKDRESYQVPDTFTKAFVGQSSTEKMREYYNRIATVFKNAASRSNLTHLGSLDVHEMSPGIPALEGAFLVLAREQFVEGIYDGDVRREMQATIDTTGMSIQETFKQAARIHDRIEKTKRSEMKPWHGDPSSSTTAEQSSRKPSFGASIGQSLSSSFGLRTPSLGSSALGSHGFGSPKKPGRDGRDGR